MAAALVLSLTLFHRRRFLLPKRDDFRATLLYFGCFFLLFLAIPALLVFLLAEEPWEFLREAGMTAGNFRRGLLFVALGAPLAIFSGFVGSRDSALRRFYPFSKTACRSPGTFGIYETAYFFLYYVPWEFLYRGLLFFPVLSALGLLPALAVQTIVSTFHHRGHPAIEIRGSVAAGIAFGLIAFFTGSFLYSILLHAMAGISTDIFVYRGEGRRT